MFRKILIVALLLTAAGCASHNMDKPYHPYEEFSDYKPYEEKLVCPFCSVEFLGEIPGIVTGGM
ncbi:hypothetical protein [Maridesulfovibrio bastinii]|jgi:hypothetical protein|uniref:hypothetical protein n=1 Tax=Maridesulfovibrio bastinii TaxID=47157 RepID=UPI00040E063E|nr:hypothetical protein [Maridesulfovibrio bastinii]